MIDFKKQILGFQINGIGNGHLTQAETVYDILIKKYTIPVVIIYGKKDGYDSIFYQSKVIYHKFNSTNESTKSVFFSSIIRNYNELSEEIMDKINLIHNNNPNPSP